MPCMAKIGPRINHFGEGCGSVTTIMNDMDISLMSAASFFTNSCSYTTQ